MKDELKIEKERRLKKLRGETEELVETIGQENELKGARAAQEHMKNVQKLEEDIKQKRFEKLKSFANNRQTYQRYMLAIFNSFLKEEQIPKKYHIYGDSSDEGVAIGILNTSFVRGVKPSGIPFYDVNAMKTIAVQVGNTIAKLEGYVHTSEAGVVLPDSLDKKVYGGSS